MRRLTSHLIALAPVLLLGSCPLPQPVPVPSPSPSPTIAPTPVPTPTPTPCPSPSPSPSASPTPSPIPSPTPTTPPTPLPPSACPIGCEAPQWLGTALRSITSANPQGGKYLGKKYNFDATPHTKVINCQDRPGESTEWSKACQAEFWPHGPEFYMSLPGHFDGDRCDSFSGNSAGDWWCHHKPEGDKGPSGKGAQVGPTRVWAVPPGGGPDDALPCPPSKSCAVVVEVTR